MAKTKMPTGARVKGSKAAKEWMSKLREMRKAKSKK